MNASEQALIRVRTLASADIETESERLLVKLAAEVQSLTYQLQAARTREFRTLELDREFLREVADSYGIRQDEVTRAFLARQARTHRTDVHAPDAEDS